MSMEALASALAGVLRPVVPPRVQVHSEGSTVVVRGDDFGVAGGPTHIELGWFDLGTVPPPDPREQVVGACLMVLEQVQDFVAEATTEPWPGERTMPTPHVTIRNGQIHGRYGSTARPVLVLSPIPLADVVG